MDEPPGGGLLSYMATRHCLVPPQAGQGALNPRAWIGSAWPILPLNCDQTAPTCGISGEPIDADKGLGLSMAVSTGAGSNLMLRAEPARADDVWNALPRELAHIERGKRRPARSGRRRYHPRRSAIR